MTYFFATLGVAVLLYFFIKRINDRLYENGRDLIAHVDAFDFLNRPVFSLTTPSEKAIFHYLVNRPWRETHPWFQHVYSVTADAKHSGDIEVDDFLTSYSEAMLGDVAGSLGLLMNLKGLPQEVRKVRPSSYSKWSKLHQDTVRSHPDMKVNRFVSGSSISAARACLYK